MKIFIRNEKQGDSLPPEVQGKFIVFLVKGYDKTRKQDEIPNSVVISTENISKPNFVFSKKD